MRWVYKMKHMIRQIRPGSRSESLFWHNYKKIFYFDSFVLQNLICTAYDFLYLNLHCITFQISYISTSDLNRFPKFRKSHAISMSWKYRMKHMINEMRTGSTNESPFWHKIFYVDSFVLQNLICIAKPHLHCITTVWLLCLDPHCIAFKISYISASDLNRFPRFCKSYIISMRWVYKMKDMIRQMRPGSTNESLFGIITRKYFILTHLYCKTLFALHMTFYASICIV